MARIFKNKERKTGFVHGVKGTGTVTIALDFLPDYLKAKFATQGTQGNQHDGMAAATDLIYWELIMVTPTTYTFNVYYKCTHTRDIHWLAAKLPKEAEIIAH